MQEFVGLNFQNKTRKESRSKKTQQSPTSVCKGVEFPTILFSRIEFEAEEVEAEEGEEKEATPFPLFNAFESSTTSSISFNFNTE